MTSYVSFYVKCKTGWFSQHVHLSFRSNQKEIILKVDNVFTFYHIVLSDILDLRIQCSGSFTLDTLVYDMSIVDLIANISKWRKKIVIIIALDFNVYVL